MPAREASTSSGQDLAARRYARAAFELALQHGDHEAWQTALEQMAEFMSDPEVRAVLENTRVAQEPKRRLIEAALSDLPPLPLNLARLLVRKGRTALAPGIAAALRGTGVHVVMGAGGAPEGVLTAAALRCVGGDIQARLVPARDGDEARLAEAGYPDLTRVFTIDDLAPAARLALQQRRCDCVHRHDRMRVAGQWNRQCDGLIGVGPLLPQHAAHRG